MANELYAVVDQQGGFAINPAGRAERSTVITFRSNATGTTGTIEVVDSEYTSEKVDAAIRAKVATMNAIAAL